MDIREVLGLLQHILVWLPKDSYIRNEVQQIIDKLKAQIRR